jgi:hypothetical protein
MKPTGELFVGFASVFCPLVLVSTVLFIRRRHIHPIPARHPWLVFVQSVMLMITTIFISATRATDVRLSTKNNNFAVFKLTRIQLS